MGKRIDIGADNPRMQCDCCGKWMRLHGVDKNGNAFQRFHGGCEHNHGNDHLAGHDVCAVCCPVKCKKIAVRAA